ncbi:hypothetical protein MRB53_029957 [Persea americana]|uniref:Uncharacterized protein n=1 Tax=Persea americana TaxID=3435 RepID=A0ACC2KJZ8_PERAE|nr:hypothetical protein MRB53_029957 [Persea americana]
MMNGGYLEILNVGVLNIPSLGQKSYQEFQHSEFHKFFIVIEIQTEEKLSASISILQGLVKNILHGPVIHYHQ